MKRKRVVYVGVIVVFLLGISSVGALSPRATTNPNAEINSTKEAARVNSTLQAIYNKIKRNDRRLRDVKVSKLKTGLFGSEQKLSQKRNQYLYDLETQGEVAIPWLRALVNDTEVSSDTSRLAVRILVKRFAVKSIPALVQIVLKGKDSMARDLAANFIQEMGGFSRDEVMSELLEYLYSTNLGDRQGALHLITRHIAQASLQVKQAVKDCLIAYPNWRIGFSPELQQFLHSLPQEDQVAILRRAVNSEDGNTREAVWSRVQEIFPSPALIPPALIANYYFQTMLDPQISLESRVTSVSKFVKIAIKADQAGRLIWVLTRVRLEKGLREELLRQIIQYDVWIVHSLLRLLTKLLPDQTFQVFMPDSIRTDSQALNLYKLLLDTLSVSIQMLEKSERAVSIAL